MPVCSQRQGAAGCFFSTILKAASKSSASHIFGAVSRWLEVGPMAALKRSASPSAPQAHGALPAEKMARRAETPEPRGGAPRLAVLPPTPSIKQEPGFARAEEEHMAERGLSPMPPPSPAEDASSPQNDASPTPSGEEEETRRISMYPAVLGRMVDTVLEGEAYLFSSVEQVLLRRYAELPREFSAAGITAARHAS
jgi:hypothetical protein